MSKREELARKRAELARRKAGLSKNRKARLAERTSGKGALDDLIPRRAETGPAPASFAQEHLWRHEQLHPGNTAYSIPLAIRLKGSLRLDAARWALRRLIDRHQILRTGFRMEDGTLVQVVNPMEQWTLPVREVQPHAEGDRQQVLIHEAEQFADQPFDMNGKTLLRLELLILGPDDHALLMAMHHIISDGWSTSIFMGEMAALYYQYLNADDLGIPPKDLPPLPIQFADYAAWQKHNLTGERLAKLKAWWKQYLDMPLPGPDLPLDFPRKDRQTFAGRTVGLEMESSLEPLAREAGTSHFMALLAVFHYQLSVYSGEKDVITGAWVANRDREEVRKLIGLFAETLPMRSNLEPEPDGTLTFRQLLTRIKQSSLDAFSHQELPLTEIMDAVNQQHQAGNSPLFRVLCVFQNWPDTAVNTTNLSLEGVPIILKTARFDLSLTFLDSANGLRVTLNYNTDLYREATAAMILRHFHDLVEKIAAEPDCNLQEVAFMTAGDKQALFG